jgi:hypothetical protein
MIAASPAQGFHQKDLKHPSDNQILAGMAGPAFLGQQVDHAPQPAGHTLRGGNEDLSGQQREQKRSVGPLEGKAAAKSQEIRLPLWFAMANRITAGFQQGPTRPGSLPSEKAGVAGISRKSPCARRSGADPSNVTHACPARISVNPGPHAHDNGRSSSRAP